MPPQKLSTTTSNIQPQKRSLMPLVRKGIGTRSKTNDQNVNIDQKKPIGGKRKADFSPSRNERNKRSALGNLTNALVSKVETVASSTVVLQKGSKDTFVPTLLKTDQKYGILKPRQPSTTKYLTLQNREAKVLTRAAARAQAPNSQIAMIKNQLKVNKTNVDVDATIQKPKEIEQIGPTVNGQSKITTRRISNDFEKTEDSLYVSALDEISTLDNTKTGNGRNSINNRRSSCTELSLIAGDLTITDTQPLRRQKPSSVIDFDKENWDDPFQVSHYAMDIFEYLKQREQLFPIDDYIGKQVTISTWMRTLLVDWMVEVQETFELNHETLYLAVKIVDIYLGKKIIVKDKLQLLGASALLISCKYDERTPPLIVDFLYICDGAYTQQELIAMEITVFKTIGYDLGIPLSYRFLRRYARCARIPMPTLTLARYVLEYSLMDYSTISLSDSKVACAALFIALRMTKKKCPIWDETLEYYSGYKLEELGSIITLLNSGLHRKQRDSIRTVRNKYSHKIFFEVAKLPLLTNEELLESVPELYASINTGAGK